jgi:hypothetical protein
MKQKKMMQGNRRHAASNDDASCFGGKTGVVEHRGNCLMCYKKSTGKLGLANSETRMADYAAGRRVSGLSVHAAI